MAIKVTDTRTTTAAHARLLLAFFIGVGVTAIAQVALRGRLALLFGWDAAALTYTAWAWIAISRLKPHETKQYALREDPSRRVSEVILVCASLASLGAVAAVLVSIGGGGSLPRLVEIALCIASVLVSWVLVHTLFMMRYAELFYRGKAGGVLFRGAEEPTFRDFAYLSFTIGMTFQVADTDLQSTDMRALTLQHALLSYVFGTVVVATTVNLVASLSSVVK